MKKAAETFTHGAVLKVEREHSREDIRGMLQAMYDAGLSHRRCLAGGLLVGAAE